MNDLPTTAAGGIWNSLMSAVASILPHGDSHEPNGTDPVLGGIRFLGVATKTASQTSTSITAVDVTSLVLTPQSRGGDFLIIVAGSRLAGPTAADLGYWSVEIDSVVVEEFGETGGPRQSSALIWFATSINPGPHTVQFRMRTQVDVTDQIEASRADDTMYLIVFEILPVGQQ